MASQEPTTTSQNLTTTSTPTRRPYHGSCHCGFTKYICYITLPPPLVTANPPTPTSTIRIRKCNCSTCHKMSFFHLRLLNSPADFYLISPLSPTTELSDYVCFDERIHWYFCPKCGVRYFAFNGESEVVEVDIPVAEKGEEEVERRKVWKPKTEGWIEKETGYLSVNAVTLEPGQEGLDLREWIAYLDMRGEEEARMGRPHDGGIY
ncbi:uncharacterized protein PAC_06785 [Phialocephala subalpina]|uniref:CENP-V/GFA domain-containing protein n=1 Tax=Phialocephala subalpina TaxID=576137 RepID=A0A1L7WVV0_9HELO|nr:uncharacterized protein PAC_06785 [Phialocephala subalpina]